MSKNSKYHIAQLVSISPVHLEEHINSIAEEKGWRLVNVFAFAENDFLGVFVEEESTMDTIIKKMQELAEGRGIK